MVVFLSCWKNRFTSGNMEHPEYLMQSNQTGVWWTKPYFHCKMAGWLSSLIQGLAIESDR